MTTINQSRLRALGHDESVAATSVAILITIAAAILVHSTPLALLAIMVLTILAAFRPAAAVAAIPAVIGFVLEPVHIRTLEFSPQEVLLVCTVGGLGLNIATTGIRDRSPRGAFRVLTVTREHVSIIDIESLIFVLLGTISLLTLALPAYRHESLRDYRWVILEPVVFYLLARWFYRDRGTRQLAVMLFVAGAVLVAISGLIGLLSGHGLAVEGVTRVSGVYHHPNALALFLERPFVLALGLAAVFRPRLRWEWLIPAALIGGVLLITFSRGAVLAAGIVTVVVLVAGERKRLAALATGAGALLGFVLAATASARIENLFSGGSGSLRLDLWQSSVSMIRDHPIFGIGLDQFLYVYAPRYIKPQAWSERFTSHPHDIVLDIWLRLGIMGVVLALAYVASFAWLTVRLVRKKRTLGLAAAGALLVGMLHGLVDNGYFLPDLALIFWFLTALMVAESQDEPVVVAPET